MSRIRIIMLSLLAVFAVSAVASASASATCYKVAVAGTGHWENGTCTVVGTTKEFVEVEKLETKLNAGEWCAKVKAGEPSTFEDNKCTKAKAGTGEFIKVLVPEWEINGVPIGAGAKETTTDAGGKQKLKVPLAGVEIECEKVVSGTVTKRNSRRIRKRHVGRHQILWLRRSKTVRSRM